MKILVTGGTGFIGSNLTKRLVENGHDVRVFDDLSLGREANLKDVMKQIKFIKGDITDKYLVFSAVRKCDYVFNLAAASSAPMFDEDPREGYKVNVMGFLNILDASRRQDVKRVLYASSSSIYGNIPMPHNEDTKVMAPNFYSATKMANEEAARLYTEIFNLDTVGFRFFSVYGPNEVHKGKYANIVSQFLWAMQSNLVPVIFGNGSQTRDFTYVDDVIDALLLAMTADNRVAGDFFNIGTGNRSSFNEVIAILNEVLNKDIKPEYTKNPIKNYIIHTMADISKIKKTLGYKPTYTLRRGIEMILK